jgi:transposase
MRLVLAAMERHEVSSGQLYTWRKQAMSGELSGAAPAALPPPPSRPVAYFAAVEIAEPEQPQVVAEPTGQIGICNYCNLLILTKLR